MSGVMELTDLDVAMHLIILSDLGLTGKRIPIDASWSRCVAPAGHVLLFAVVVRPPHDGVRRPRHLNMSHDLIG